MPKIYGLARIKMAGQLLRTKPGVTYRIGGLKRTMSVGHSVYGAFDTMVQGQIAFTVAKDAEHDQAFMRDFQGDITIEEDTGDAWVLPNACQVGDIQATDNDGGVSYTFEGDPMVRL